MNSVNLGKGGMNMGLDLKEYRLEHITSDDGDIDYHGEITQRVINVKPELFWMLRHTKDSHKNIMLMELEANEKERVYSYYMLTWVREKSEMLKVLDGNARYIERLETAIVGYKEVISKTNDLNPGIDDMFVRCPQCNGILVFRGNGFCVDCGLCFEECKVCEEYICVCAEQELIEAEDKEGDDDKLVTVASSTVVCVTISGIPDSRFPEAPTFKTINEAVDYLNNIKVKDTVSLTDEGDGVNTCVKCGKGLEYGLCKEEEKDSD